MGNILYKFHVKQSYTQFHVKPIVSVMTYPHLAHNVYGLWISILKGVSSDPYLNL